MHNVSQLGLGDLKDNENDPNITKYGIYINVIVLMWTSIEGVMEYNYSIHLCIFIIIIETI